MYTQKSEEYVLMLYEKLTTSCYKSKSGESIIYCIYNLLKIYMNFLSFLKGIIILNY